MRIDLTAYDTNQIFEDQDKGKPAPIPVVIFDYPKSAPVLESSYIFPKVEDYGHRIIETYSAYAVSKNI